VIFTFNPKQDGEFISGIPARDLTEADLLNLSPIELRDIVGVAPGAHRYYEPTQDNKDLPKHLHLPKPPKGKAAKDEAEADAAAAQDVDVPIVEGTGDGLAVVGEEAQTVDEAHQG
jgi:hypothetical protein